MAGMQFEYDEEGGTFYYFLLSFWSLVLIPATYYLWPRKKTKDEQEKQKKLCNCEPCQTKRKILKAREPWIKAKEKSIQVGLIFGWVIFLLLAYKVSKIQMDYVEYDPFLELEVDRGASAAEIKRAYRKLSLIYHPDKETGNAKKFMRIAKAYAALTDEESKKNWEEFGNPDGPGATRFGIALPKWIVERENSMWVLAVYLLVFMIVMPVVVGAWWYRSIKFSGDQVLLDTTRLYWYFFNKTPNMILKRAVMILGASFEFDKFHNSEVMERPSDNEEIPILMKALPNLQEKNKERPLCFPYSVKARALVLAHCQRLDLPPDSLEMDKQYILKKSPHLINEMVNICAHQVAMAMAGRMHQAPRLETMENLMKLSQMIIQAVEEKSSPLQQLPHINSELLRHFVSRKRNIRGLRDFVAMEDSDRRAMLRSLSDQEYTDIMNVCSIMPHVEMNIRSEVLDDDDNTITAGSIVTVTVKLTRTNMLGSDPSEQTTETADHKEIEPAKEDEENEEKNEEDENEAKQVANASPHNKPKAWEKPVKKKGKKGGKQKKKPKQAYQWKAVAEAKADAHNAAAKTKSELRTSKSEGEHDNEDEEERDREVKEDADTEDEEREKGDNSETDEKEEKETKKQVKRTHKSSEGEGEKEEEDWSKFQEESRKENSLETKVKESHVVHCPYFPLEKQEWWWLYVADRKRHQLITAPVQICSLKKEEEVQLKFSAPPKPSIYQYSVILRSDSYFLDFDRIATIKLDVKEAKPLEDHPQWDISDDEEQQNEDGDETEEDSDYSSEDDDSD
ncbi:translocation protein SEC63 homolog [Gigantopelta aegis]|uniref:translocation protein SEC63 homolog n=1 Tax=Gigantopelta aegis TaxID=1735272 RepID=UPI001B888244|nr:translocation protein SEC63 homolog [Gigantopelta aegis]